VPNKKEPTEKMLALKRALLLIPKSKRKAVLENGRQMASLRKERDQLKA
jgi:hypothetical protein